MKAKDAAFLSVLLLVIGLGLTVFSSQSFENVNIKKSYNSANVWNVTGYVEEDDVIAIDLKASNEWSKIISGEETEIFPVDINITVFSSNGENASLICHYEVYLEPLQTPILSPLNVSSGETVQNRFLDIKYSGPAGGYLRLGRVNVAGNITVVVSSQSVWENFLSTYAPRKLTLAVCEFSVVRPYLFLLPLSLILVVSSIVVFWFKGTHRRFRKRIGR
ncbi:MAG: hypothetical protein QHH18_04685 [Candidatus Bathyarchaeota archaeon]|nr:hypothetical protein [Candidatus Bathyarchaeota archaeon A05DMB-5]MDH7557885.1 hypothetical protein [Candidatus Bathyarchaeota archaeon]